MTEPLTESDFQHRPHLIVMSVKNGQDAPLSMSTPVFTVGFEAAVTEAQTLLNAQFAGARPDKEALAHVLRWCRQATPGEHGTVFSHTQVTDGLNGTCEVVLHLCPLPDVQAELNTLILGQVTGLISLERLYLNALGHPNRARLKYSDNDVHHALLSLLQGGHLRMDDDRTMVWPA